MRLLPALSFCLCAAALAQQPPPPPELQPVPDGAPEGESGAVEPEVTIIRREGGTIQEYRFNGRLYMVKVQPDKGIAYYLIDTDGDGELDVRYNDLHDNIMVPGWVIYSW